MEIVAEDIYNYGKLAGEVDTPIIDQTGLTGRYDFSLEYKISLRYRIPAIRGFPSRVSLSRVSDMTSARSLLMELRAAPASAVCLIAPGVVPEKPPACVEGPSLYRRVSLPTDLDTVCRSAATTGTRAVTAGDKLHPKCAIFPEVRGAGGAAQCLHAGLRRARSGAGVSR